MRSLVTAARLDVNVRWDRQPKEKVGAIFRVVSVGTYRASLPRGPRGHSHDLALTAVAMHDEGSQELPLPTSLRS